MRNQSNSPGETGKVNNIIISAYWLIFYQITVGLRIKQCHCLKQRDAARQLEAKLVLGNAMHRTLAPNNYAPYLHIL